MISTHFHIVLGGGGTFNYAFCSDPWYLVPSQGLVLTGLSVYFTHVKIGWPFPFQSFTPVPFYNVFLLPLRKCNAGAKIFTKFQLLDSQGKFVVGLPNLKSLRPQAHGQHKCPCSDQVS